MAVLVAVGVAVPIERFVTPEREIASVGVEQAPVWSTALTVPPLAALPRVQRNPLQSAAPAGVLTLVGVAETLPEEFMYTVDVCPTGVCVENVIHVSPEPPLGITWPTGTSGLYWAKSVEMSAEASSGE